MTDEQHRFGVKQRESFAKKGGGVPHVLVMRCDTDPENPLQSFYTEILIFL